MRRKLATGTVKGWSQRGGHRSSVRSSSAASRWTTRAPARRHRWTAATTTRRCWNATLELHRLRRRGRAARLRLVLDDRAPLPVRGLRGDPERHPDRRTWIARPHLDASASARCSTSSRSGTRCAWPRTSRRCTTSSAGGRSSASAAAPCPARCCTSTTSTCRSARYDNPDQQARRCPQPRGVRGVDGDHPPWRSTNDRSRSSGKHFQFPIPGIPDRGATVQQLTLVPRPLYPYEIWQAVTSPPTLEYVPVVGHGAVFWNQHYSSSSASGTRYGEPLRRRPRRRRAGAARASACSWSRCASRTRYEEALRTAPPGHDEFWKFLGPYGWSRGYMGDDGKPAKPGPDPVARRVDRAARRSCSAHPRTSPRACSSTATCSASST